MATVFGATYAFSLATVLSDVLHSGSVIDYMKATGIDCDVDAKRCILEKFNLSYERDLFQWAIGTRDLTLSQQCEQALDFMKGMGGKYKSFADWLSANKCDFSLWFQTFNCSISLAERYRALIFDTNSNESYHNRVKSFPKFAERNGRGVQFMNALQLLRELDQIDAAKSLETYSS
ncbi:hypothetical protein FGB62_107g011 [Gracilaria domingensis]|nr:hypothetical protein FGB62_107g011 [Gracilaria domingensis]